jgi:hypothetical protein
MRSCLGDEKRQKEVRQSAEAEPSHLHLSLGNIGLAVFQGFGRTPRFAIGRDSDRGLHASNYTEPTSNATILLMRGAGRRIWSLGGLA